MMKQKRLFKTLFVLLLVVLGYTNMLAQGTVAGDAAPYAVLSENTNGGLVLTFYCDDQKTARNGMDVGPFSQASDRGWANVASSITKVVFDDAFEDYKSLTSTAFWFDECSDLTEIFGLDKLRTLNVTDMNHMFSGCHDLSSLDVSNFKTDNVTNMSYMFNRCSGLTSLDVSNFKTDNVEYMAGMFFDCASLTSLDVSNFSTAKTTDMSGMFAQCSNLTTLDVSNFNTSSLNFMTGMFQNCSGLTSLDLSNFNTSNVTDMRYVFYECSNLATIYVGEGWNTSSVYVGENMFAGCPVLVGGAGTHYNPDRTDHEYARIDGGPNSQTPGYFTKKGDAPWVEPNALVLTGKIDNYWYDETGNPDGFEAIIINVPLPPDEVSVWESNVLNTFVENKLAFTTQGGEPVDNVEGRILFTEKGHWKTIDGGRILVYEDANMQGEVAEIDPEWGMIRILNTDVTFRLLSATDRYVSLPLCVKAYIGDDEMPLTNGSFTVMLTKPLSIESISLVEISFENSEEVSVPLDELIHLQDWRNKQLVRNDSPDLYEYYRVDSPMITGTENGEELNKIIMTDLGSPDGSLHSLSEMAPDLAVSYNPDLNHGMLTFVNNGGQLGSFTIFVPVTINHEWGYLSGQVIIKVHEGDMPADAEPYAVLSDNNTVLTFYYDEHKEERNGMSVSDHGWSEQRKSITNVVFDASFANCTTLISTSSWFIECSNLVTITGINNLNTSNVVDMSNMFFGCSSLISLDVSGFNTANVTNMRWMFVDCTTLKDLDVSNFNTANVIDMDRMFQGCSGLTSLDLSNFNTSIVMNMYAMFSGCSGLKTVYVGDGWTTSTVMEGNGIDMFSECINLVGGKGTHYDPDHTDYTYARIDGGPDSETPGYFTKKGDEPWVDPATHEVVLTGKDANYWRGADGYGQGEESVVLNSPLPPADISVWENSLLDMFVGNQLTFTTPSGGPVNNVKGRFYFEPGDKFETNDFGTRLMLDREPVAEMNPETGQIRIVNSETTRRLLEMNALSGPLPIRVKAYGPNDEELMVTNGLFNAYLQRPVSATPAMNVTMSLPAGATAKIVLDDILTLEDWRGEKFDRNASPNLYEYYRVQPYTISENGGETDPYRLIQTDLGGQWTFLYLVAPDVSVTYDPTENNGTLTFVNNGAALGDFTISIPVTVSYEWGEENLAVRVSVRGITYVVPEKVDLGCSVLWSNFNLGAKDETGRGGFFGWGDSTGEKISQYEEYGDRSLTPPADLTKEHQELDIVHVKLGDLWHMPTADQMLELLNKCTWTHVTDYKGVAGLDGYEVRGKGDYANNAIFIPHSGYRSGVDAQGNPVYSTNTNESYYWSSELTDNPWGYGIFVKLQPGTTRSAKEQTFLGFHIRPVYGSYTPVDPDPIDAQYDAYTLIVGSDVTMSQALEAVGGRGYVTESVAAIVWNSSATLTESDLQGFNNPNMLIFVMDGSKVTASGYNVVVNGAIRELVLKDVEGNGNFIAPMDFKVQKISYTREFRQQTQIGISRGWESLALPFAVQTITHQDKGVIAPFGSDASGLHFWLRRLGREGLTSVQRIEANTPYVISMPNSEDYASRFNLNGRVTFAAEDVTVPATATMVDNIVETDELALIPAFQRMAVSEDFYALNVGEERNGRPEGSIFERNYREVRPFEAYTVHRGDRPAPLFFDLSDLEGSTTDVPDVRWMMDDGNGEWYDLQGRKLGSTFNVQRSTLKKGVYIHNGRKTVVR